MIRAPSHHFSLEGVVSHADDRVHEIHDTATRAMHDRPRIWLEQPAGNAEAKRRLKRWRFREDTRAHRVLQQVAEKFENGDLESLRERAEEVVRQASQEDAEGVVVAERDAEVVVERRELDEELENDGEIGEGRAS